MTWLGGGLTDTAAANEIAYGLISPYLDMSQLAAATEELEPGLSSRFLEREDSDIVIPADTTAELERFWLAHPDLRAECVSEYGFDPVDEAEDYWDAGLDEPEHADILAAVRRAGEFTVALARRWERQEIAAAKVEKADARAAGIAVRAADTGRVLMIQRSLDPSDPARGTWEFPGGKMDDGEHPLDAAKREWEEETGLRLPDGRHVGEWRSGIYRGFVYEIDSEAAVKINADHEDRRVLNPDDPDGDQVETMAWLHPEHLRGMKALRPELRRSKVWAKVEKGDARPAEVYLRVHGVSTTPAGMRVYRMVTRDGHYVGRTNATRHRARKGDVLKVAANDLLRDSQGDLRWMNANVVGGYTDAPHSWRDLEALAGGPLVKDGAPGPAGDIPPAGDEGTDQVWPSSETMREVRPAAAAGTGGSGPTSTSVHVDAPLPNVSQFYGKRGKGRPVLRGEFLPVSKAGAMKQLVYGVVLEPNSFDSQDDFMLPHHVEQTAHGYLKNAIRGKSAVAKLQHRAQGFFKDKPSIVPVESFIAPVDFTPDGGTEMIKKGSWVLCMHVEDPELWQRFLDGEFEAFSVGGSGVRQSLHSSAGLDGVELNGMYAPDYFASAAARAASLSV